MYPILVSCGKKDIKVDWLGENNFIGSTQLQHIIVGDVIVCSVLVGVTDAVVSIQAWIQFEMKLYELPRIPDEDYGIYLMGFYRYVSARLKKMKRPFNGCMLDGVLNV